MKGLKASFTTQRYIRAADEHPKGPGDVFPSLPPALASAAAEGITIGDSD
jgi:hypothetical protein